MMARFLRWIRERRSARAAAETRSRFASAQRRPAQPDILLEALRRPAARRKASRPVGAEPGAAIRPSEDGDPLWVRRLDSQIVILPTLPGSGTPDRRADS